MLCLLVYRKYFHRITLRNQVQQISNLLEKYERFIPLGLAITSFLFLARIKLMQHVTFHTGAFDLAMYDTAVRNTLQGRFMFAEQLGRNFFSEHFSPILLLFCPLYLVADTPVTLLLVEAFCVASGLRFAYKIARHYCLTPLLGRSSPCNSLFS